MVCFNTYYMSNSGLNSELQDSNNDLNVMNPYKKNIHGAKLNENQKKDQEHESGNNRDEQKTNNVNNQFNNNNKIYSNIVESQSTYEVPHEDLSVALWKQAQEQNEKLKEENKKLKEENEKLKEEIESYKEKLLSQQQSFEELKKTNHQLQVKNCGLGIENHTLSTDNYELRKKNNEMYKKIINNNPDEMGNDYIEEEEEDSKEEKINTNDLNLNKKTFFGRAYNKFRPTFKKENLFIDHENQLNIKPRSKKKKKFVIQHEQNFNIERGVKIQPEFRKKHVFNRNVEQYIQQKNNNITDRINGLLEFRNKRAEDIIYNKIDKRFNAFQDRMLQGNNKMSKFDIDLFYKRFDYNLPA